MTKYIGMSATLWCAYPPLFTVCYVLRLSLVAYTIAWRSESLTRTKKWGCANEIQIRIVVANLPLYFVMRVPTNVYVTRSEFIAGVRAYSKDFLSTTHFIWWAYKNRTIISKYNICSIINVLFTLFIIFIYTTHNKILAPSF